LAEKNQKTATDGFGEAFSMGVMMQAMDIVERRGDFLDEVEEEVCNSFLRGYRASSRQPSRSRRRCSS
jgi:hypothetical protein